MIKDFNADKCSAGKFILTAATAKEIVIPDDAIGVKIVSDTDLRANINAIPGTPADDTLTAGIFIAADIMEVRILQNGQERKLYLLSETDAEAKVEFWG